MSLSQCALLIVTVTLIGVAIGRYPWLKMNRTTIALVGAAALLVTGVMTLEQA
jgi:Na+/H+ antiporter NhaD/arsenite permease-like protein